MGTPHRYREGQWYYAYNLLSEIDSPGEWYLDREATLANGDHAVLETRHELHDDAQKVTRHHRYQIKDRPETLYECTQTIRWGEPSQWKSWLQEAGFEVTSQFLDFDEGHTDIQPGPEDHDGIITTLAIRP